MKAGEEGTGRKEFSFSRPNRGLSSSDEGVIRRHIFDYRPTKRNLAVNRGLSLYIERKMRWLRVRGRLRWGKERGKKGETMRETRVGGKEMGIKFERRGEGDEWAGGCERLDRRGGLTERGGELGV